MIVQSIYLHNDIADTLRCYGGLSEVVDKILSAGNEGSFDITDRPPCRTREGATRYEIKITDEDYIALLKNYPPNSPKVSLRRLLYWFVENEIYDELGWEQTNKYINSNVVNWNKSVNTIVEDIHNLADKPTTSNEKAIALIEIAEQLEALIE